MGNLANLFDALYTRFLLRDFVGKVVPGSIVMVSVLIVITSVEQTTGFLGQLPLLGQMLFMSIAWVLALAMQSFSDYLGYWRYFPKGHDFNEGLKTTEEFLEIATDGQERQYERFVVIKEACGNCASSIIVSSGFWLITGLFQLLFSNHSYLQTILEPVSLSIIIAVILALFFLLRMHRQHAQREYDMAKIFLERHQKRDKKE